MITRKHTALAALAAAALLPVVGLTSCGDTETEWVTAPTISAAQAAVTAPDGGGTVTVALTVTNPSDGSTISASPAASWVTVDSCTETSLTLTAAENPSADPRTARVTVSYSYSIAGSKGTAACEVTVAQSCGDQPYLSVSPTAVAAAIEGGSYSFSYTIINPADDGEVSASCSASWITDIDCSEEGTVGFTVAENPASQLRQAEITLSYSWGNGSLSETVTVVQNHESADDEDGGDGDDFDGDIEGTYTITGICYYSYPNSTSWTVTIHYEPNSPYTDSGNPYLIDGLLYVEEGDYGYYTQYCAKARVENGSIIVPAQITQGEYDLDETGTRSAYLGYVAGYIDNEGYLTAYDNYPDIVFTYNAASESWSCNYGIMGFLYDSLGDFNSFNEYFVDFNIGDITLKKSDGGSGGGGGGIGGGNDDGSLGGTYTASGRAYAGSGIDADVTWTLKLYSYDASITASFPNYSGGLDYYIDGMCPGAEGSYDYYGDHRASAAAYVDGSGNLVVPTQVLNTTSSGYYFGWTPCTAYTAGSGWSYNYGWPDLTFVYNSNSGCWESEYGIFMGAFTTTSLTVGVNSGFASFFDVVSPGMTLTKTSDTTSLSVGDTGRPAATLESLEKHFDFNASYAPVSASNRGIKTKKAGIRVAR